jgi:glycosyltransferase involved in cell wall biosynthesis
MTKKNILFVVTSLRTGGIMRSLQNFLNCYDVERYNVDVFVMVHEGGYKDVLSNCNLLPLNKMVESMVNHLGNRHGFGKVESILLKIANKVTNYRFQKLLFAKVGNKLLGIKHYDAVIGFSEGLPTLFVAALNHPNKIGWIHCDYASYMQINGNRSEFTTYEKLQHVACVSDFTCRSFCSIYPSMTIKTLYIYNIIDDEMMREKAKESIPELFDNSYFNIVSVGRIDPVKRLSIIPEMAKKILDAGCRIKWYVIGPKGTNDEVIRFKENLAKYGMESTVIPIGEKANPYPYIAKADLLVNTSVSEACPYVINEAKILHTPVVCSDFGSAKEFIDYGEDGYYEPIEQIPQRIEWLINNKKQLFRIKSNLSSFSYNNALILSQMNSIFVMNTNI